MMKSYARNWVQGTMLEIVRPKKICVLRVSCITKSGKYIVLVGLDICLLYPICSIVRQKALVMMNKQRLFAIIHPEMLSFFLTSYCLEAKQCSQ